MKTKIQVLAMMFIAAMAFGACDDDDKNDNITVPDAVSKALKDKYRRCIGDSGQTQAAGCMVHKLVPPYHFRSFFLYRQLYMNLLVSSTIRNRIHACP